MTDNALVHVDDASDLYEAHNRIVFRDAGNSSYPALVSWVNNTSSYVLSVDNAHGEHANFGSGFLTVTDTAATITANVNGYIFAVDNAHGEHANFGTGVIRITDTEMYVATTLKVITNNILRLYDAADTDYADLQAEASGGLTLVGSGNTAGIFYPGAVALGITGRVLANVSNGAAGVQAHPKIAGPAGWLFIVDDGNFTAIYTCEGGGSATLLLTGGSGGTGRWGSGTAAAGASHTSVYATGGVVTIKNETGGTRTYYMLWIAK